MPTSVVLETSLPGLPVRRGKVRDIYDLGDRLLLVSTDRLSAFDWVLPTGIPDKGRLLTQIAAFWFAQLAEPNHLITTDVEQMDLPAGANRRMLAGRSTLCRKTQVVPIECVVRGYLAGSGWQEYQRSGTVCGVALPAGLTECAGCPTHFHPLDQGNRRTRREYLVRSHGGRGGRRACRRIAPPQS